MQSALVHGYRRALRCFPAAFRDRYADEMYLDFEDALHEAMGAGGTAALRCVFRQGTDLCSSLLREWSRGTRVATTAATTVITCAIWALALLTSQSGGGALRHHRDQRM